MTLTSRGYGPVLYPGVRLLHPLQGDTLPGKLVASIEQRRSGARVVKLAGALDEAGVLDDAVKEPTPGKMLINLAGIDRINSFGAREWINWLATLEKNGSEIVLLSC